MTDYSPVRLTRAGENLALRHERDRFRNTGLPGVVRKGCDHRYHLQGDLMSLQFRLLTQLTRHD